MKRLMTMLGVAGLAVVSFAAVDDTLISFSTPGPDKYADGSDVLLGECYALVWSKDGVFEGIKADGATVDSADKVVLVAPVAEAIENGVGTHCPPHLYQVDSDFVKENVGGQYAVYLLDTRIKAADGSIEVGGIDANGAFKAVNSYGAVSAGAEIDSKAASIMTTAVGGAKVETLVDVGDPVITAIKMNGATITISTTGLSPVVGYKVVTGAKLDNLGRELDAEVEVNGVNGDFTFEKPVDGSFFKVKGFRKFDK